MSRKRSPTGSPLHPCSLWRAEPPPYFSIRSVLFTPNHGSPHTVVSIKHSYFFSGAEKNTRPKCVITVLIPRYGKGEAGWIWKRSLGLRFESDRKGTCFPREWGVEEKRGLMEEIVHWWGRQLEIKTRTHNLKYFYLLGLASSLKNRKPK